MDKMNQQGPSKNNKRAKNMAYAKPGSLSAMENKKRRLLTTNETVQALRSHKENLLKLIEKQQPVAPQSEAIEQSVVEQHVVEEQHEEDQVQMADSATPTTNEHSEEQAEGPSTRKTRGKTQMHKVHGRQEKKLILLNRKNQPVGPSDEVVTELSSFLGTLARTATLCPFDIFDWRHMDTKKDLWDYTKSKYDISDAAEDWALERIREAWRKHRSDLKEKNYDPYENDEVRMAKRPENIPECQFKELPIYWKSEKFKKMSKTNTENRKKLMNPHTAGKKSFFLIRNKLEKEKGGTVLLKDIFVATRARKSGRTYKASNENTTSKIAEMKEIETQLGADDSSVDAFSAVMGPEHLGRLRMYGGGVTKTSLKRINGNSEPTSNVTNDAVQQMQERMQKMEYQIEEQKRTIRQEVIADVIAQLQHAGLIDPNILAALPIPSPRESTSAPAATGRNNQGDDIEDGNESDELDLT